MIFKTKFAVLLSSRTYSFQGKKGESIPMYIATLVDSDGKPFEARLDEATFSDLKGVKNATGEGEFELQAQTYAGKPTFHLFLRSFDHQA